MIAWAPTFQFILLLVTANILGQVNQPQFECSGRSGANIDQIKDLLKRVNSFSARFEQISYSAIASDIDFGDGELFAAKPRNIRVNYSNPSGNVYIFSGDRAMFENTETGEREYFRVEKADLERLPVSFLVDGKVQDGVRFDGSCENVDGVLFNFVKEAEGSKEFELRILTDKNISTLKGIQFKDFGGAVNSFLFSSFRLNPDIPADFFKIR